MRDREVDEDVVRGDLRGGGVRGRKRARRVGRVKGGDKGGGKGSGKAVERVGGKGRWIKGSGRLTQLYARYATVEAPTDPSEAVMTKCQSTYRMA